MKKLLLFFGLICGYTAIASDSEDIFARLQRAEAYLAKKYRPEMTAKDLTNIMVYVIHRTVLAEVTLACTMWDVRDYIGNLSKESTEEHSERREACRQKVELYHALFGRYPF